MAVSDTSPNPDNFTKGSGKGYFKKTSETVYRDLGYLELINMTPAVDITRKMAARNGGRKEVKSFVNQVTARFDVQMMELTPSNLALQLGGTKAAAVTLSATGDTASAGKTIANLGTVTNLVKGRRYAVSGTGIPTGASGIYDGISSLLMEVAATATATGVSLTITAPQAFGLFDVAQTPGSFKFDGDNDVGLKVSLEALNVLATPNGDMEVLNSNNTDIILSRMTLDVQIDTYGNLVQIYLPQYTT